VDQTPGMSETSGPLERFILERLDAAVRDSGAAARISRIVERVDGILARDPEAIEAWEPIPLDVYGGSLPEEIRSSWVFVLRRGVATGAERHPNSRQRMVSWRGTGDFQVHDGQRWRSHLMTSGPDGSLVERWISIPPNTWHQGVVGDADWAVVSFHTVPAGELIEERPGPDEAATRRRRYLDTTQA
jgi:hypothetical protein